MRRSRVAPVALPPDGRVLVADDNADMRDYISRLLGERWVVDAVPDGRAALAHARARRPDVVVSDVMMPGLDGFELLRALRADERTRSVPIILLSARAGEEARVQGLQAGADDYLVKPFPARELVPRVQAQVLRARCARSRKRTRCGWRASSSTRRSASRSSAGPRTSSSSSTACTTGWSDIGPSSAGRSATRCPSSHVRACTSCSTGSTPAASRTPAVRSGSSWIGAAPSRRRRSSISSTSRSSRMAPWRASRRCASKSPSWSGRAATPRRRTARRTSSSPCSDTSCATRWPRF